MMNPLTYILATILLWVPTLWLFPVKYRLVKFSYVMDHHDMWKRLLARYLLLDLVRTWVGMKACFSNPELETTEFLLMGIIPMIGVLIQLWHGDNSKEHLNPAPIAYLAGITLAMLPPICALGTITLAGICTLCLRSIRLYFLVGAILAPPAGYLLGASTFECLLTGILYFLPLLISRTPGLCLPMKFIHANRLTSQTREVIIMDSRPPFASYLSQNSAKRPPKNHLPS